MPHHMYAAVDIGGTKIAAALVAPEGTLLTRVESPTPARAAADVVMGTVAGLIAELAADPRWAAVAGVGIGSAGPVDPTRGTVSPVNIPAWRDFPLVDRVAQLAPVAQGGVGGGGLKVVLLGDGSAMAAGEHWRGSARGYDNALCLVVSTGVGAGLILDGELRTGPSGNAGHLGHISVDFEGEDCPCGSRGCLERYASGTAIAKWAVQHGWRPEGGSVGVTATATAAASASSSASATAIASASTSTSATGSSATAAASGSSTEAEFRIATSDNVVGRPATAADVAASALRGNEIALAAFDRAGRALAAGIASTAMLVDIRAAVIGGGVAKAGSLLLDPLVHHLARYASLPFTRSLAVLPATLGADAGLIGAAAAIAAATTTLEADRRQP